MRCSSIELPAHPILVALVTLLCQTAQGSRTINHSKKNAPFQFASSKKHKKKGQEKNGNKKKVEKKKKEKTKAKLFFVIEILF